MESSQSTPFFTYFWGGWKTVWRVEKRSNLFFSNFWLGFVCSPPIPSCIFTVHGAAAFRAYQLHPHPSSWSGEKAVHVSSGCEPWLWLYCRPMVIDGRGYYTPYSGSMLDPQHQLGTANPPTVLTVRRRLYIKVGEAPHSTCWGWKLSVSRLIFVNSIIVSRQQTWRQQWDNRADTHYWEGWHIHRDWCCCCNTVTKQQETSHTDHWHCIVIEIWVSVSFLSSLPLSVSLSRFFFPSNPADVTIFDSNTAEQSFLCSSLPPPTPAPQR